MVNLSKELQGIFFNPKYSKYSINIFTKKFPKETEDFLVKVFDTNDNVLFTLNLTNSRKYYKNKVYKFYIDNYIKIKEDNSVFIDYINTLDSNTKKSLTRNTIKATYPLVYESWLKSKEKIYTKDYLFNSLIKGTLPKKITKEYVVSLLENKEALKDFKDGVKASLIVRKYHFKEDINLRCKSCSKPLLQNTQECRSCIDKYRQHRANIKREQQIKEKLKDIEILNGNFDTNNFYNEVFRIKCNKCGLESDFVFKAKERVFVCTHCKNKNDNTIEKRISEELDYNFELRNRTFISPLEVDLLSKEHKIGIEYNGLIWHSYGMSNYPKFNNYNKQDKNRHLNKTIKAEEKGYNLYHIFENEWMDKTKKDIWKSLISTKLHKNITKIPARKCIIKEVNTKEAKDFLEQNHLQGYSNASIKIGLYYNDALVSLMTFGKPRFNKRYEYELIRFCTKKYCIIQGGGSKLLKHFERTYKPKSLISYANRRWSKGDLYKTLGFKYSHSTEPNYFYFKTNEKYLYNRYSLQKHKLKNILENYNESLNAEQNIFINGYRKIFDCGNLVYVKEYK